MGKVTNMTDAETKLKQEGENAVASAGMAVFLGGMPLAEARKALETGGLNEAKRLKVDPDHAKSIVAAVLAEFDDAVAAANGADEGPESLVQ